MTSRRRLWILLAVFAAAWFCNLGYRHLFKPDEGRYAEIPREMAASGDWLTPRLNGFKYFEKPALQYWATAAAFGALGQNEWAARLWPGLAGFFGVLLVFWTGNRLFGPPVGLYVLIERDRERWARLHLLPGGLLFLAITAPWFVAVSLANSEFFRFFFIHEHVERFPTREHDRYEPGWYFVPVLLLGIVPWIVSLFPALWSAWARSPGARFQPRRFLFLWCAVVFAFFSASSSKLGSYILPMFPALALLVGHYLVTAGPRIAVAQAGVAALLGIALIAAAPYAVRHAAGDLPAGLLAGYVPWLTAAGLALAVAAVLSAWLALRERLPAAAVALAFGGLVSAQAAGSGHEELSPVYSAYHIVQKIRNQLRPDVPFYVVNTFDHTLLFYLGRTVTMVASKDELEQPIAWEPQKFLPDTAAFARTWQSDREAFAMFNADDLAGFLRDHPVPMQIVARDARRIIVRKP